MGALVLDNALKILVPRERTSMALIKRMGTSPREFVRRVYITASTRALCVRRSLDSVFPRARAR